MTYISSRHFQIGCCIHATVPRLKSLSPFPVHNFYRLFLSRNERSATHYFSHTRSVSVSRLDIISWHGRNQRVYFTDNISKTTRMKFRRLFIIISTLQTIIINTRFFLYRVNITLCIVREPFGNFGFFANNFFQCVIKKRRKW